MTPLAKQRLITGTQIGLTTLGAAAAVWFCIVYPLFGFVSYMYSPSHPPTDAQMIRDLWHFRLIQPEWLARSSDHMMDLLARWEVIEAGVRALLIFAFWATLVAALVHRHRRLIGCQQT
jgi:hypothetical protein